MLADRKPEEIFNTIFAVSEDKSIPEILKEMSNEKLIKSFYLMGNTPEGTQLRVLQDILKSAKDTEFGKKYGFAEIETVDAFRKKVPFSDYSQVAAEIDRLKAGAADIFLTALPPVLLPPAVLPAFPSYCRKAKTANWSKVWFHRFGRSCC